MKRLNTVPMRFFATLLLIMGTVTAHAQYYLNICQTDGTRLRYAVSAVDSLWFNKDEHQEPSVNYKYVDLGLSVKWATFNVGASKPEEYGDYYAWGETEPHYEAGYAQEDPQTHWKEGYAEGYNWSTYKYCNDSYNSMTKYCSNSSYGNGGFTDTKTTLDLVDDVAHVKWGGSWRMPTRAEQDELRNNCTWTWITQNGVNGYLVTSKIPGHEGASIFLPAVGNRFRTSLNDVGSYGEYWSSSLYTDYLDCAFRLEFISDDHYTNGCGRDFGQSVRPVCP